MSFYIDPFNRLFLHVIQRHTVISHILEINSFQVYATDVAIVHGAIINDPISRIRDYCELRSARDISRCFPPRLFSTRRNIEIIQDMKCLKSTLLCRRLLRCCQLKESRTNKPGWRGEISRKSK